MYFDIDTDIWEHNEYVVTIRPDFEKTWRSLPIGCTLSKQDAITVADWLRSALPELYKIFININKEEKIDEVRIV